MKGDIGEEGAGASGGLMGWVGAALVGVMVVGVGLAWGGARGGVPVWGVVAGGVVAVGVAWGVVARVVRRGWVGPVGRVGRVAGEMGRGDWGARVEVGEGAAEVVRELAGRVNAIGVRARQQLEEREERWRVMQAMVEALPDAVMLVEAHRRVRLMNAAAGRVLGVGPGRAVGKFVGEVVKDKGLLETLEAVPAAGVVGNEGGERPVEREVRVERDGEWLTYQAVAVRTADGVLLLLRDVTALTETVRMKTDFVANASHELRTPVAAIKAALETLGEVYREDPEQVERCVRIIGGHVGRLEEMLRDLLDLSRLEGREFRVEWGEVRAEELFGHVRGSVGEMAERKGVEVSMAVGAGGEVFRGDVRLLNMVVKNLVENAVKFTPGGGGWR